MSPVEDAAARLASYVATYGDTSPEAEAAARVLEELEVAEACSEPRRGWRSQRGDRHRRIRRLRDGSTA